MIEERCLGRALYSRSAMTSGMGSSLGSAREWH
jgi:hypothetical protein